MSEDSYLLEPKEKKRKTPYDRLMTLLKICFFICAFAMVIFTVLANMGGNNETLHEGVTHFISEISGGRPVELGKLNYMGFFPTVRVDMEDVAIYARAGDKVPLISLESFRLGIPFWNVATRLPRISEFYVQNFEAIKGVLIPEEFQHQKAVHRSRPGERHRHAPRKRENRLAGLEL